MIPISKVSIGDVFQRPYSTIFYVVVDIDIKDKMIKIESSYQHPALQSQYWKKNTDSIFNYRVLEGNNP